MLVEGIYDNGRLLFNKQINFAYNRFKVSVEVAHILGHL